MKIRLAMALLLAPALPATAGGAMAYDAVGLDGGVFEVLETRGPSAADFWCGAGQYAIRELGKPVSQRIYVWRGRGDSLSEPGRRAVQFSFAAPPGGSVQSLSNSVDLVGNNLSTAQAQQHCFDRTMTD